MVVAVGLTPHLSISFSFCFLRFAFVLSLLLDRAPIDRSFSDVSRAVPSVAMLLAPPRFASSAVGRTPILRFVSGTAGRATADDH